MKQVLALELKFTEDHPGFPIIDLVKNTYESLCNDEGATLYSGFSIDVNLNPLAEEYYIPELWMFQEIWPDMVEAAKKGTTLKIFRPIVQALWENPLSHSDRNGTHEKKRTTRWYWTCRQLGKIFPHLLGKDAGWHATGWLLKESVKPAMDPMIEMIKKKALFNVDTTLTLAFTIRIMSDIAQIKKSDTDGTMADKAFEEWFYWSDAGKAAFDKVRKGAKFSKSLHLNANRAENQQAIFNATDYCWNVLDGTSFSAGVGSSRILQVWDQYSSE